MYFKFKGPQRAWHLALVNSRLNLSQWTAWRHNSDIWCKPCEAYLIFFWGVHFVLAYFQWLFYMRGNYNDAKNQCFTIYYSQCYGHYRWLLHLSRLPTQNNGLNACCVVQYRRKHQRVRVYFCHGRLETNIMCFQRRASLSADFTVRNFTFGVHVVKSTGNLKQHWKNKVRFLNVFLIRY